MHHSRKLVARSAAVLFAALGVAAMQPAFSAPKDKVGLCHVKGNGGWQPITVSSKALGAHLAHGDVQRPNGAVPGSAGYVFDSQCNPLTWDYFVNATPDAAAEDPAKPGTLYTGSGIPATNFGIARNEAAGIELGMQILYRQGPTVPTTDNYDDGVLEFDVASGAQSTANGSSVNRSDRAAWNFTFSIATGLNAAATDLSSYTFQILYDVDPGPGTSYRTLTLEPEATPQAAGQSGYQWRDAGTGLVFISDDEGNLNVTQNSQNYAFGFFQSFLTTPYGLGNGFAGPAKFDIVMQVLDGGQIIVRNHIAVNVAAP